MIQLIKPLLKIDFLSQFGHRWCANRRLKFFLEFLQFKKADQNCLKWAVLNDQILFSQLTAEFIWTNESNMFYSRTPLMTDSQTANKA